MGKIIEFDRDLRSTELLKKHGLAMPDGFVDWTPEKAAEAAKKLPGVVYVVKSLIHAGGRDPGRLERPTRDDVDLANKEIDDERDAICHRCSSGPRRRHIEGTLERRPW
jgi:succinyl-CoA synthetase beta subunit